MSFTPGPWSVCVAAESTEVNGHPHLYWAVETETEGVAIVVAPKEFDTPEVRRERAATARLIAAAPLLLSALREALPILESMDVSAEEGDEPIPVIADARAALAAAEQTGSGR